MAEYDNIFTATREAIWVELDNDPTLAALVPIDSRIRFASGLRVVERFQALAKKHGKTPVQVAIAWVLSQGFWLGHRAG